MSSLFSNRLKSLRKEKGLTQEKFAETVERSRSTISGWEIEGKEPNIKDLCMLANFFGVSVDYLTGNAEKRNNIDTVFFNDLQNFKKHYESAPQDVKMQAERCFDAFYRLIVRDVQINRMERLAIYNELFNKLASLRAQISRSITYSEGIISDPVALSDLMALQSELKNEVSAMLDRLMQADMEVAFGVKEKETGDTVATAI